MKKVVLLLILLAAMILLGSCSTTGKHGGAETSPSPSVAVTSPSSAMPEGSAKGRIAIDDASGRTIHSLERKADAYKIYDGDKKLVGEVKIEADRVKVKDQNGKVLWKIKKKESGCKLTSGSDAELYKIKGGSGDYKIKDSRDSEVARIKIKGDYLEINGMVKVRAEGDRIIIDDEKGARLFTINGDLKKEEGCFLGLTSFEIMQRIGLMIYFKEVR